MEEVESRKQLQADKQERADFTRDEDFTSLYANNVRYESSAWDVKIIFGQLDQSGGAGKTIVEQHTAVTVTWPNAKIMAYFLLANCLIQQSQTGPIQIPLAVIPPRPEPSDEAWATSDKNMVNYLRWIHDQFFGQNPYTPPGVDAPEK
jgi:hypothetical protein